MGYNYFQNQIALIWNDHLEDLEPGDRVQIICWYTRVPLATVTTRSALLDHLNVVRMPIGFQLEVICRWNLYAHNL